MTKTFCPIPWVHQATRNNGDIRVCCQANMSYDNGTVRKDDGSIYNAGRDNVQAAFNASVLKEIRLDMLSGKWNQACTRCKVEEETGLPTRRLQESVYWQDRFTIEDARNHTATDGTVDLAPRYYDLRFGNFCNLKCRMCGPSDSNQWYEEHTEYYNEQGFYDTQGFVKLVRNDNGRWITDSYNWHEKENFWKQLEDNISNLEHVYMVGGEPLLIERHEVFIQKCIDLGYSKNIILNYNTNLTVLPARILEMWKQFKQIRVGASIDGYGAIQEYQRYPVKWSSSLRNLQALNNLAKSHTNIRAAISYTVTVYNVFHLPEFMWWRLFDNSLDTINVDLEHLIISHHMAHGPMRMNVQVLPTIIKDKLRDHYIQWIDRFQNSDLDLTIRVRAEEILQSVINFAYFEDHSNEVQEFIKFTRFLDQKRNEDIRLVVPQLGELFD